VGSVGRLVGLPADRHRGEVGRIGLEQQAVGWHVLDGGAELLGLLEGQDAADAEIKTDRHRPLGQPAGRAVAVNDAGERPLGHLLFQDGHRVVVGVAGVDDQRQPGLPRGVDVRPEARRLPAARRQIIEMVEAALADGDNPRMPRQLQERGRIVETLLAGLVRVDAHRADDLGPALGEFDADRPAVALRSDVDHEAHARRASAGDHPGLVLGEARVVEVAVAVDDHAASGSA
jgi:hypothetical protein